MIETHFRFIHTPSILILLSPMLEHERRAHGRRHRAVRAAHGAPDDFVEQQIIDRVFPGEIHLDLAALAVSMQLKAGSTCLRRVVYGVSPETSFRLTAPPKGE
jgi:hypothetical protein